jgi:hypothetical protein
MRAAHPSNRASSGSRRSGPIRNNPSGIRMIGEPTGSHRDVAGWISETACVMTIRSRSQIRHLSVRLFSASSQLGFARKAAAANPDCARARRRSAGSYRDSSSVLIRRIARRRRERGTDARRSAPQDLTCRPASRWRYRDQRKRCAALSSHAKAPDRVRWVRRVCD